MVEKFFDSLEVYRDDEPRSAAMNMAMDEAMLESATVPSIRFYRWDHPALSFGYFGRLGDIAEHAARDSVRRWTGGGIVLHGEDLTYSIVIPASDPAFRQSALITYAEVHRSLRVVLIATGTPAVVAAVGLSRRSDAKEDDRDAGATDPGYNRHSCFANPVRADVLVNGRKVAGAAQRRTRRGLLQQGSIQNIDLAADFEMRFADELSNHYRLRRFDKAILSRANEIAAEKYSTDAWLRRR